MNQPLVLYALDQAPWSPGLFEDVAASLPLAMADYARAFVRWQDRQARLLARLLLREGLQMLGEADPEALQRLERTPFGRPYLPGLRLDFSISHTQGITACALLAGGPLGLDLEAARLTCQAELGPAFCQRERACLAAHPGTAAARIWTAKEAALKAQGEGLLIEPSSVDASGDVVVVRDSVWHIVRPDLGKDFACALACEHPRAKPLVRRLDTFELLRRACAWARL